MHTYRGQTGTHTEPAIVELMVTTFSFHKNQQAFAVVATKFGFYSSKQTFAAVCSGRGAAQVHAGSQTKYMHAMSKQCRCGHA